MTTRQLLANLLALILMPIWLPVFMVIGFIRDTKLKTGGTK